MAEFPSSLRHDAAVTRSDEELWKDATAYFARSPPLQVVAELLAELQTRKLPWWTPDVLRGLWSATDRMGWLERRADLRQQITSGLTGLVSKAARNKTPEFQGELIDSAIDDGDITTTELDTAFDPRDLAIYGPAAEFWTQFRRHVPWNEPSSVHQDLMVWIFRLLLTDKSSFDGVTRRPILTILELRSAIPSKLWQTHLPLDVRAAIDDARLRLERSQPPQPFLASQELSIATPKIICASVPLIDLQCVLDAAERAMGLSRPSTVTTTSSATSVAASQPAPQVVTPAPVAPTMTTAPVSAAPNAPLSVTSTLPQRSGAEKTVPTPVAAATKPPVAAATAAASPQRAAPTKPARPAAVVTKAEPLDDSPFEAFEDVTEARLPPPPQPVPKR